MRTLTNGFICMMVLFITSCGPSKDLIKCQAKSDSLSNTITQLNSQVNQLNGQLNGLNSSMNASNAQIAQLQNQNMVAMQEASDCKRAKEAVAARMEELNQALAANGTSMKEIRRKAEEALIQFANAGVDVTYKNGLV